MTSKTTLLIGTAVALLLSGSAAFAADLYVPPAAPIVEPVVSTNWDGPYIGANVGYGWGSAADNYVSGSFASSVASNTSGWLIGGQIGYNFHLSGNIVLGVEGNIDWLNETGSYPNPAYGIDLNWEGSARARLGYDGGSFLPYVEAGVAFANATLTTTSASSSNVHTGWTVGAGVEFMLADHLSANVEYRYSDYGTQNYATTAGGSNHVGLTDSTVRVGLNYHF